MKLHKRHFAKGECKAIIKFIEFVDDQLPQVQKCKTRKNGYTSRKLIRYELRNSVDEIEKFLKDEDEIESKIGYDTHGKIFLCDDDDNGDVYTYSQTLDAYYHIDNKITVSPCNHFANEMIFVQLVRVISVK